MYNIRFFRLRDYDPEATGVLGVSFAAEVESAPARFFFLPVLKSVSYQPLPLSLKPAAEIFFENSGCWHSGQSVKGASLNFCKTSFPKPHDLQTYSYIGIKPYHSHCCPQTTRLSKTTLQHSDNPANQKAKHYIHFSTEYQSLRLHGEHKNADGYCA